MQLETVIHSGTIVTAGECFRGDVGIAEGRIAIIAEHIAGGERRIDAGGRLVVPGGIETHAHIEQENARGIMPADDYLSGSVSAAFGGNSSFVPFAVQHRGQAIPAVLSTYEQRAGKSVIDYSWHLTISDANEQVLSRDLPAAFARGIASLKVFTTYDQMNIGDGGMLDVLTVAKAHGAVTMVHAENTDMIKWMNARLSAAGHTAPRYQAISRPELAEEEAINRVVALAKLVNAPLFVVHVSTAGGAAIIRREKAAGARLFAETCSHYLALDRGSLDIPGMEGAKYICSPPLRDAEARQALWHHVQTGTFDCVSSDHAPARFDETGKFVNGRDVPFSRIAGGLSGIAFRLPHLFSEGVLAGRITPQQFVAMSATNAARIFGLKAKGSIAPGMDADIAIWNPEGRRTVTLADQHDNMDYTPYEGFELSGRLEMVMTRGQVVVDGERLVATSGQGRPIGRHPIDLTGRPGHIAREFDPERNFGARIAP